MKSYDAFLASKLITVKPAGFEPDSINEMLYPFQKDIVKWACRKGKACIFADCGMGKTPMQLEWANQVHKHCGEDAVILIVAPLAVSSQTAREGYKFGIHVNKCRDAKDIKPGINIINYEILHKFEGVHIDGIVLDESSILKSFTGKVRNQIIDMFEHTPYKLACTATPSPNDYMELGNHAEFVGAMTRTEMLAMFFVHDGGETSKWRLKGHAKSQFWDWVSQWAVVVTCPEDLGYDNGNFNLPDLNIRIVEVETDYVEEGKLFATEAFTLQEQQKARRDGIVAKADYISQVVNSSDDAWLIWCDLNDESEHLALSIPDSVEVRGSNTDEYKEDAMLGFADGKYRVMVTKPSIAGFGMNWQHCHRIAFCGLSHSYEQFYQAVRRCWRYGQTEPVDVAVVVTTREAAIVRNVLNKKSASDEMAQEMTKRSIRIKDDDIMTKRDDMPYITDDEHGDSWRLMMGDCVERIKEIDSDSVGYTIFSPPFASLYTYSNSNRDMGNCKTDEEFHEQFSFLISELYRVTMPGRLVSFHCMNLPTSKERDGYIGIKDFRGELIRAFQEAGFIYHSEVCIWKDPVTAMQRTKALGLLNKQKNKDSSLSRQGIPDYLVTMRKPGENPVKIEHDNDHFPISMWQRYASPVWMDINPSRTLQYKNARTNEDERHICPLQLDVIERGIDLWSAPGDVVLSPFAGIGSEGYVAVKKGRKFIGIELKPSYFKCAVNNLKQAEDEATQLTLDDYLNVCVGGV